MFELPPIQNKLQNDTKEDHQANTLAAVIHQGGCPRHLDSILQFHLIKDEPNPKVIPELNQAEKRRRSDDFS